MVQALNMEARLKSSSTTFAASDGSATAMQYHDGTLVSQMPKLGAHSVRQGGHTVCRQRNLLSTPSLLIRRQAHRRLWPRTGPLVRRQQPRCRACAQAAHLSAPSSCTGSCCARNTHRVGKASGGPCTGPVGGELHQLGGHAVAGPPTNQLQTTTGHLSGHFLKGSVQQDDFCDEGLCLGDNACRDTASRVHASKVPAPAAHLGSPVLRAGAQQSVIWRKGNAVDVLVMGSNGSHGRQLERISTQILRCRRCLATLLVGLAVLGPLQDSCQVPNFQDLVSAT